MEVNLDEIPMIYALAWWDLTRIGASGLTVVDGRIGHSEGLRVVIYHNSLGLVSADQLSSYRGRWRGLDRVRWKSAAG